MPPEAVAAAVPRRDNTLETAALVGALGLAGWLAYRYWYIPMQMREAALAAGAGNPLSAAGQAACQLLGAKYGLPPSGTSGICSTLGQAAASLVQQFPELLEGTGRAAGDTLSYIGAGAGSGVGSLGQGIGVGVAGISSGVGQSVASLSSGVASGAVSLGTVPIRIASGTAGPIYGGAKQVTGDVSKAFVASAKGVGAAAGNVARAFASIF